MKYKQRYLELVDVDSGEDFVVWTLKSSSWRSSLLRKEHPEGERKNVSGMDDRYVGGDGPAKALLALLQGQQ